MADMVVRLPRDSAADKRKPAKTLVNMARQKSHDIRFPPAQLLTDSVLASARWAHQLEFSTTVARHSRRRSFTWRDDRVFISRYNSQRSVTMIMQGLCTKILVAQFFGQN
jgi:hypothetical protein